MKHQHLKDTKESRINEGYQEIKVTEAEAWASEVFKCKPRGIESQRISEMLQKGMKKKEFETTHD